jgi:hypothetical protein
MKAYDKNGSFELTDVKANIYKVSDLLPSEIKMIYTTYATTVIYTYDPEKIILLCDTSEHTSFEAVETILNTIGKHDYFIPFSGNCNPLHKSWSKENHYLYPPKFREQTRTIFLIFKLLNSEKKFSSIFPKVLLLEIIRFSSYNAFQYLKN